MQPYIVIGSTRDFWCGEEHWVGEESHHGQEQPAESCPDSTRGKESPSGSGVVPGRCSHKVQTLISLV